jgi:hypothetical protein
MPPEGPRCRLGASPRPDQNRPPPSSLRSSAPPSLLASLPAGPPQQAQHPSGPDGRQTRQPDGYKHEQAYPVAKRLRARQASSEAATQASSEARYARRISGRHGQARAGTALGSGGHGCERARKGLWGQHLEPDRAILSEVEDPHRWLEHLSCPGRESRLCSCTVGTVTADDRESTQWKIYGERLVDENPFIRLSIASVGLPDGTEFEQYVMRMRRAATTVVVDDQDRVLLMRRGMPVLGVSAGRQ